MAVKGVEPAERHVPAFDPVIRRAYWGYCAATDWPFWRIIPKGKTACPFCGESLPAVEAPAVEAVGARASSQEIVRLEFYFSSNDSPAEQFQYARNQLMEQLDAARARSIHVKVVDVSDPKVGDLFLIYNAAVIGPPAAKRAVFGMKGALIDNFGRRVPVLLAFTGASDRYPAEVFPRMDRALNRIVGVQEGLEMLLAERAPAAAAEAAEAEEES